MDVDLDRKRISLTMRMDDQPAEKGATPARNGGAPRKGNNGPRGQRQGGNRGQGNPQGNKGTGSFGQLLANAMAEKKGK